MRLADPLDCHHAGWGGFNAHLPLCPFNKVIDKETTVRKGIFGLLLVLVALSVIFSIIGVLSVWNPGDLFAYGS